MAMTKNRRKIIPPRLAILFSLKNCPRKTSQDALEGGSVE
jgi:hypothetical protein